MNKCVRDRKLESRGHKLKDNFVLYLQYAHRERMRRLMSKLITTLMCLLNMKLQQAAGELSSPLEQSIGRSITG